MFKIGVLYGPVPQSDRAEFITDINEDADAWVAPPTTPSTS